MRICTSDSYGLQVVKRYKTHMHGLKTGSLYPVLFRDKMNGVCCKIGIIAFGVTEIIGFGNFFGDDN